MLALGAARGLPSLPNRPDKNFERFNNSEGKERRQKPNCWLSSLLLHQAGQEPWLQPSTPSRCEGRML